MSPSRSPKSSRSTTGPSQGSSVERLRFYEVQRVQVEERCRVRVRLEFPSGGAYVGEAEGPVGLEDELRTAADATVDALRKVARANSLPVELELREVAAFEAFGKPGVMVSLTLEFQNQVRTLLGFSPLGADGVRSVALAVLGATNRVFSRVEPAP